MHAAKTFGLSGLLRGVHRQFPVQEAESDGERVISVRLRQGGPHRPAGSLAQSGAGDGCTFPQRCLY
jgi:hypothetical protein